MSSNHALINKILSLFDLVPTQTGDAEYPTYRGFSGAIVYRVETNRGPVAVRRWPRETLPEARIRGLHRLLRHLSDRGLQTIALPFSVAGHPDKTVCRHRDYLWHCERWLPGERNLADQPTPERLRATMRSLAEWHRGAELFRPDGEAQQWFGTIDRAASPAVNERLTVLRNWTAGRLSRILQQVSLQQQPWQSWVQDYVEAFIPLAPLIEKELQEAATWQVPLQPCLRDVWHDHILFQQNRVSGIIDPTAARTENVTIDLARLLGSLFSPQDPLWETSISAYEDVRPLQISEHRLLGVLYRSGTLLNGLSWILRFTGSESHLFADPAIADRMQLLRNRLFELRNQLC